MKKYSRHIYFLYFISFCAYSAENISNPAIPVKEIYSVRDHFNEVDLLKILTKTRNVFACSPENNREIIIEGQIGPDARHAIYRLLDSMNSDKYTENDRKNIDPITISLRSEGGFLNDAYEIGKTFRYFGVTTLVENGQRCISSCAIAFLGGKERILEDGGTLLFHAPHYLETSISGGKNISCDIHEEEYSALLNYFKRATGNKIGSKLFERTIQHCSVEHGWIISESDTANRLGIGTKKQN